MTTLIIARHGNTFNAGDVVTRVGGRTDLPLVDKGRAQAEALGQYLSDNNLLPDVSYASTLQRTQETAKVALQRCGVKLPVYTLNIFDEIDYGPDENKPEADVVARIGQEAIELWDKEAIVPVGWEFDPAQAIENWQNFAAHICNGADSVSGGHIDHHDTVLVVTSNGIARFAPYITGDYDSFRANYDLKLSTGALGILEFTDEKWAVKAWNIKPKL